jgi:hypothetical protein
MEIEEHLKILKFYSLTAPEGVPELASSFSLICEN